MFCVINSIASWPPASFVFKIMKILSRNTATYEHTKGWAAMQEHHHWLLTGTGGPGAKMPTYKKTDSNPGS
jgi:hypothetical protein